MKKVLAITCILVLVLLVSSTVMAAENNWRFKLTSDDGTGGSGGVQYFGMGPTAQDTAESQDASYPFIAAPGSQNAALVGNAIGTDGKFYNKDIRAGFGAGTPVTPTADVGKTWDWRIGAGPDAQYSNIRIQFWTMNNVLPPATFTVGGAPQAARYTLTMVNNKGVEGAPANGTVWILPIPTVHNSVTPYFTLTLPIKKIATFDAAGMQAGGYQMEFKAIAAVPEPSSLLALGTGLVGMIGFVARRRRA